jgi:hypothetical protein
METAFRLKLNWIMEGGWVSVKFGSGRLCPKCNREDWPRRTLRAESWSWGNRMTAFEEHREELEHYEQMFGKERGRLAVSLDRITNALVLTGQHGVYCTSQRNPTVPAMDLRMISQELTSAKELIQSVMEEMRKARRDAHGPG